MSNTVYSLDSDSDSESKSFSSNEVLGETEPPNEFCIIDCLSSSSPTYFSNKFSSSSVSDSICLSISWLIFSSLDVYEFLWDLSSMILIFF